MNCSFDFEPCEVWREKERKAARAHRCNDCGGIIKTGELYLNIFAIFDGESTTAKRCADCEFMRHEVGRAFFEECGGWSGVYIGELPLSWDDVVDAIRTPEEANKARQIVAAQHAACEARGGSRKWSLAGLPEFDEVTV